MEFYNKMLTFFITTTLLMGLASSTTVSPDAFIPNATAENPTQLPNVTKPTQSRSQTQQINLKLPALLNISAKTDLSKAKEFRPSPQLNEHYEYNKYPVPPANPEAKTFGTVDKIAIYSTIHTNDNKDAWSTNVRFPSNHHHHDHNRHNHHHPVTVNDHPYPYANADKNHYGTGYGGGNNYDFTSGGSKYPYGDSWDKTLKQTPKPAKSWSDEGGGHTDLLGGLGGGIGGGGGLNPWKKIVKMLAAVIPIGLLISALTPSVITIMPTNGTSYRSQARNLGDNIYGLNLLSKLGHKNCDERIFCELLLSAEESKNTDKDIEVLLDNFLQKNGNSEKLNRIYKAIRNGNCTPLQCDTIPKN